MSHRLVASSSDIVVEAEAGSAGEALVELARAFTEVTTKGSRVGASQNVRVDVKAEGDLARLAVAFVDELILLFTADQFLPSGGELSVSQSPTGSTASGTLLGETFDRRRHAIGTEVKAATLHDAVFAPSAGRHRIRLLLDL